MYQVKDVTRLTGVSVRALHHYDEIGLLSPSGRSDAGYRLYSDDDLLRLQQILIGRELGLSLEEIRRSLDDPSFDRRAALEQQRAELVKRAERTSAMLRAIDAALASISETRVDLAALFDGFDPAQYEDEVQQRWGDTAAYAESARRTRTYTKADWERYKAETDAIMTDAAHLFLAGAYADGDAAMAIAERHRLSIDRWFYPCAPSMHASLADLYDADPRFAANIDKYAPGLTAWWTASIRAAVHR